MTALKWITAALVAMLAFPAFVLPSSATGGSDLGNPGLIQKPKSKLASPQIWHYILAFKK
ncbi:MAG: hypothetical protein IIA72_25025 [Proteobacteria bacterium]|nr:hypothetical protein [Pseudomonadota bacterium]